jgi:hypothetical protein
VTLHKFLICGINVGVAQTLATFIFGGNPSKLVCDVACLKKYFSGFQFLTHVSLNTVSLAVEIVSSANLEFVHSVMRFFSVQ